MPSDLAAVFLREGWAQVVTDPKAGATEQKVTTPPENKAAVPDATDAAIELAKENEVDLSTIEGTGSGGRILKSDVERALTGS